jgi:hypothetical protein
VNPIWESDAYQAPQIHTDYLLANQINQNFSQHKNLLIDLTWVGPRFEDMDGWQEFLMLCDHGEVFDNLFLVATIDPPSVTYDEINLMKNMTKSLFVYYLGNFDSPHQFNFFAVQLAQNFVKYDMQDLILKRISHCFINYNKKPLPWRVDLIKRIMAENLSERGIITIGTGNSDNPVSITDESQQIHKFAIESESGQSMQYYSLDKLDTWQSTFLYINSCTVFDPDRDLFCQQDVFKPLLGIRPFLINGNTKTYRWLRLQGFRTFNQYWPHIDVENGPVHDTIIDVLKFLVAKQENELMDMFNDMLPDLHHNHQRFWEYAEEQKRLITHDLFAGRKNC